MGAIGRSMLLALAFGANLPCHSQVVEDWPTDPPARSNCRDAVVRRYVEGKFDGLDVMTRLAQRRYPGSRVQMGVNELVSARIFKGACVASVPFYFFHPDHLELWAVMLVDSTHKAQFISVRAEDFVPFETWISKSQAAR